MTQDENFKRPITGVFPILRYAIDKGIDAKLIFEGTRLSESDLLDSQNDIILDQELTMIRNLIKHAPSPETPWELGRYFNTRAHGALGSMTATAPTVGDVISSMLDYAVLSHSFFRLIPETKGERFRVYLTESRLPKDLLPFLIERDLIAGITTMENRLPGKKPEIILTVSFAYEPRTEIEKYKEIFIDNVRFNQPTTYFDIDRRTLSMPIPDGDHQAFELFRQQCQAEYSLRNENRFYMSDRVRLSLQRGKGQISVTEVAKQLNMSERSLRRQLAKEGVSFRKIRNQYIFQQSLNLLRDPKLHIEEISDALGYSETCAFTRAFQRWTGKSPGKYRKEHIDI